MQQILMVPAAAPRPNCADRAPGLTQGCGTHIPQVLLHEPSRMYVSSHASLHPSKADHKGASKLDS